MGPSCHKYRRNKLKKSESMILSFIQYLNEHRERTPEEATRLLKYIRKRGTRLVGAHEHPDTMKAPGKEPVFRYVADPHTPDPYRNREHNPKAQFIKPKHMQFSHTERIPIRGPESKLRAMQDRVKVSGVESKLHKVAKDPDAAPAVILRTPVGDNIIDRHHHISAARALRKTHYTAKIYKMKGT